MKTSLKSLFRAALALAAILLPQAPAFAQGTAFTYQGRLNDGTGTANGSYDLTFALHGGASGAAQVGTTLTNSATLVSNGLFTILIDFGPALFTGPARWLEIGVKSNGVAGDQVILTPRQPLTPTPYAIFAGHAQTAATVAPGGIDASALAPGAVGTDALEEGSVQATDVNVASFDTTVWRTVGNGGTTRGTHFLGTTDNQPLEFKVNGQRGLRIEPTAGVPNLIGGSSLNTVGVGAQAATIAGGIANAIGMNSSFSAIGGGRDNNIVGNSDSATIAGGFGNNISNYSWRATIAGGVANRIGTNSHHGAIGGGWGNLIAANTENATIPGGYFNAIGTNSHSSTIGGGRENNIAANSDSATIAGGFGNNISNYSWRATIAGGVANRIGTNSHQGAIGGGWGNLIAANSENATIPGGLFNTAVSHAFAAGTRAKANHTGAFVWADSQGADFGSTAINQFNIRAAGGLRLNGDTTLSFGSSTFGQKINLFGTGFGSFGIGIQPNVQYYRVAHNSAYVWYFGGTHSDIPYDGGGGVGYRVMSLSTNGLFVYGTIAELSDRNVKAGFEPVDPRTILEKVAALPITRWHFTNNVSTAHIGPMAQDFHAAFGLGTDEKLIATVDADGVALAAIQGLNAKVESGTAALREELNRRDAENRELRQRLERLERLLEVRTNH